MNFTFKFKFGDDIRRLTLNSLPTLSETENYITNIYGDLLPKYFAIKYKDEEGDLITFAHEKEFIQVILDQANKSNGKILLYISEGLSTDQKSNSTPNHSNNTSNNPSMSAQEILDVLEVLAIESPQDLVNIFPQFIPTILQRPEIIPQLLESPVLKEVVLPSLLNIQQKFACC